MDDGFLEVRLLGRVEAALDGRLIDLGGPRQRALLALLAIDPGRTIPADRLADGLWPGTQPDRAVLTLRTYVSRLRVVLAGTTIRGSAEGYLLDIPARQVDARRFTDLIRDAETSLAERSATRAVQRLERALEMWRGRPFGELSAEGRLRVEADRLEDLRLRATELLLDARLALGAGGELVDELEDLVRDHPYREAFWRQLMLALYRAERQAEALATYQRARSALDEELGIDPGPELQALETAILRHEVPPAAPPEQPQSLPESLTSFVGRESEMARVEGLVEGHRLVTLTGVGGVGKTRLAIEVARRAAAGRSSGVTFVDLSAVIEPAAVAGSIASACGIAEAADARLDGLLRDLRDSDRLLLLDNCEHLRGEVAEVVARLLRGTRRVGVLATSREVLGVPGEVDVPVPPLALPPSAKGETTDLAAARVSESVALFLARAESARAAIPDDDTSIATIAQICSDLDGLPLAIELAAARARSLSLGEIAERLRDRFAFLVSWRALAPARHQTLREAMAWSYDLLSEDERVFLRRAAAFVGGFSLDAASAFSGRDEVGALRLVERLLDASLLSRSEADGATRYRMLETVRQYAASLADPAETAQIAAAHARYMLRLAIARRAAVEAEGRLTPFRDLVVEDVNLRAALRHLETHDDLTEDTLRFVAALWRYWWLHGQLAHGRAAIDRALERAPAIEGEARVEALRGASSLALRAGDIPAAIVHGQDAVEAARDLGGVLLARAEGALANAVGSAGDVEEAAVLYRRSTDAFRAAGQQWDLAISLMNTADNAFGRGDMAEVERAATESLALTRSSGDDAGTALNLGNLAFAALTTGDIDRAERLLLEALERSQAIGFPEWVAIMLAGLGAVAAERGQDARATRLLGAAARMRDEIGASLDSIELRVHERTMEALRGRLGAPELDAGLARGRDLSTDEAIALATSG